MVTFVLVVLALVAWTRVVQPRAALAAVRSAPPPAVATATDAPTPAVVSLVDVTATPIPTVTSVPTPAPTPTNGPTATATARPAYYSDAWLRAHPTKAQPAISAKAALVVDYDTRRILYAKNEHEHLAQASTTKITLTDVALDIASPDTPMTISKDATEVEPDHMGVQVGETLTLQELLYGALLDSGNDAGWAIAEGLGGLDHVVGLMNQKVLALGLHDSHYMNPVGFDDPQHYTSAYDLAVITADALNRHPLFRQIVGTKQQIIESTKTHSWFGPTNLNSLLWTYQGAWGVKPGWTDNSGYCLVAAATRNGHTVLVTLLDSNDHFADGATLLNYGFSQLSQPSS